MARIGIQIKSSVLFVATKHNVCPAEKRTKRSSILLLRLVRFSAGQTLVLYVKQKSRIDTVSILFFVAT